MANFFAIPVYMGLIAVRMKRLIFRTLYRKHFKTAASVPHINGICYFGSSIVVGKNVHFNGVRCYGEGTVFIGDNFHSGTGLKILTQNHNYNGVAIPYDSTVIIKNVVIEDNVWVGMDVLILPGVLIGEGAIIQAGSVVSISIPPLAIAGGNPAKVIRYRNESHYYGLKANGSFL